MDIENDIKEQFLKPNNALIKIILINVIVYLIDCILFVIGEISHSPALFNTVYAQQLLSNDWTTLLYHPWTAFTYFFSHDIPLPFHILVNMLGMYWFGYILQDLIGSRRLISLYILGGLFAGLAYLLYVGSPQSKEGDERKEEKLDYIIRKLDPDNYNNLMAEWEDKFPKK